MGRGNPAVLVGRSPAGLLSIMAFKFLLVALALGSSQAARQLRASSPTDSRSLANTFPFNANQGEENHHHGHHGHHEDSLRASSDIASRDQRQRGGDVPVDFGAVAAARPGSDGKRCIDKVEMVEETEYDDVVQCDHSYDRRCRTTYVTNYESQQEEECEENYRKTCFIEYEQIAFNETVQVCRTPLVKDCDVQGPEICRTEYESECWTKQEEHDVEDDVVSCTTEVEEKCEDETSGYTKEPREICAPSGCGFKEGEEECYEKTQTVVQDAPKEECTLEPQRTCKHVTKLVPKLEPAEECVDVPKEVCTRSRVNPRKIKKPVVKKWCYIPSPESGLA